MKNIGKELDRIISEKGMVKKKLAENLGITPAWLIRLLKQPSIDCEMLDSNITSLTVRDQARHSSLAITNIYAARRQKANSEVLDYRGSL